MDDRSSTREELAGGTSGAVYVEFLIAFIPFFVMVLGMIQSALLYTGHLVVQHSATTAARAAIVVLPDDPRLYDGAPVNTLAEGSSSGRESPVDAFIAFITQGRLPALPSIPGLGGGGGGGGGGDGGGGGRDSDPLNVYYNRNARMKAIHDAASIPLLAISPSADQLAPSLLGNTTSVLDALGRYNPAIRAATGALIYNRAAVAVTFPSAPNASTFVNSYGDNNAPVTVRVTYLFHCAVPIARRFMCDDPISIRFGSIDEARRIIQEELGSSPSPADIVNAAQRLRQLEQRAARNRVGANELRVAPLSMLALAAAITGQRFAIVRAEATLPLQGASYQYRTRPRGSGGGGRTGGGG
jgi:hypothetical protein